jgi:LytS/YehU family sensor histidine kinase
MVGMNLGIKLYFKADEDAKEMRELEKKSLEQQLAYLKYQINPHFFMNTLNNIHALVDIDPEKSKETILILSKIMRYVLYEGDKSIIPLQREIAFMNNYIDLMRIRYTDKVKIEVEAPEHLPDVGIPPLLLITFVENAFKHGVSYQQDSLIHIKVGIDHERLKFVCRNTKTAEPNKEKKQGGVGLANVKQRLELLYGKNFTLDLEDGADSYEVMLLLPLERIEG